MFHVYVDPLHGDNALASSQNPSTTAAANSGKRPLSFHPETIGGRKIGGLLQHAPYPFKTLTRTNGALAYIYSNFFDYVPTPPKKLPWRNDEHGSMVTKQVAQVVIHCRPGLYGPSPVPTGSGLPFNDEDWPAVLRDGVSLQGTSALDTIFDARGQTTAIIEVNELYSEDQTTHEHSFIDALTLRGARAWVAAPPSNPPDGAGAGIFIRNATQNSPVLGPSCNIAITNCFIYDNTVGIGINGWTSDPLTTIGHRARIINNTIAWNRCGVWSGRWPNDPNNIGAGSTSAYANNIFDSGSLPASSLGSPASKEYRPLNCWCRR